MSRIMRVSPEMIKFFHEHYFPEVNKLLHLYTAFTIEKGLLEEFFLFSKAYPDTKPDVKNVAKSLLALGTPEQVKAILDEVWSEKSQ